MIFNRCLCISLFVLVFAKHAFSDSFQENIDKANVYIEYGILDKAIQILESIKTTNFNVLKNKEKNEGFQESAYSKETGKKIDFFNKGFNNRWQKILPDEIKKKADKAFKDDLIFLNYKK